MTHTIVHDTHELIRKEGGIGAVIDGILKSEPLGELDQIIMGIAGSEEIDCLPIRYRRLGETPEQLLAALRKIELELNVGIHYGNYEINGSPRELILVNPSWIDEEKTNKLKGRIYELTKGNGFALESNKFDKWWYFEGNFRKSLPLLKALKEVLRYKHTTKATIVSHEYMGAITLIASMFEDLKPVKEVKRVYWGHEFTIGRDLSEEFDMGNGCGHDTMFYNVLEEALRTGKQIKDIPRFWEIAKNNYKYNMIMSALPFVDDIIAVSEQIKNEFVFGGAPVEKIKVIPNGIPVENIGIEERTESRERMRQYSKNLGLFDNPTYIFTQVARCIPSKGFWRSAGIMHYLDDKLNDNRETAVCYLVVNSGFKTPRIVHKLESNGWPVEHSTGEGDLESYDKVVWEYIRNYNQGHENTKIVLINQFVSDRGSLGKNAPEGMSWADFRKGTDVELNPAIYEPFGISPIEPLPYGGLVVISSVNGCAGFLKKYSEEFNSENPIIIGDYISKIEGPLDEKLKIGRGQREEIENMVNNDLAGKIVVNLRSPLSQEQRLAIGQSIAQPFSWENISREYLLNVFNHA